jgi:2-(1,2-epoxy-1,2-dihydrophenyl)acetyl-CoA isomerase
MTDASVLTKYDTDTGIGTITFNRPEVLNAIDVSTARTFLQAVQDVTAQPGLRCIVIRGSGHAFVAGGDVATFGSDPATSATVVNQILDAMHPALLALRAAPAPVVVAVHGVAAGGGLSLVLNADYVIAANNTKFVFAYDKLGVSPDCGGTWFLVRKAGLSKASELMLLGQPLSAYEAEGIGIVNHVVAPETLNETVDAVALKIASGPTKAFSAFARLIDDAPNRSLSEQLEAERDAFVALTATADFQEGVAAFLDKRLPEFKGK